MRNFQELKRYLEDRRRLVNRALKGYLARRTEEPGSIRRAMRYSVLAGGKRLRPILAIAAAECCGGKARRVLPAACALEMIHTYSLIHDDLPAMDDDDLRRGKPTNHKVFGEALAILAGDGLLTYAFELAALNASVPGIRAQTAAQAIHAIARGAGTQGMVGGQVADLKAERTPLRNGSRPGAARLLHYIHRHKTAALIAASVEAGAMLVGASRSELRALKSYGLAIGHAFQVADDILDIVGDKKKLGKKGSDRANRKLTYPSLYGLTASREKAARLAARAHRALEPLGRRARMLHDLADYVIERDR